MDPHERATSVWYRIAGLLRRKEVAVEIIEAEIRSAQQEVFLEAAKLVLTGDPIEIARKLHERAERTVRPK
jgi:glutamine synthetase